MVASTAAGNRNRQLDGLRGYAAISVAFFHTITALDYSQVQRIEWTVYWKIPDFYGRLTKLVFALLNGETPVVIFFVLSGAVLVKSLMRSGGDGPFPVVAWQFLVRRFFRIYPPLLLCLLACWTAFNLIARPISVDDLVKNIFLYDFKVNGATWTLNIEMLAAPLILVAFFAFRYFKEAGFVLAIIAISAAFVHVYPAAPPVNIRLVWTCFALGMLIPTRVGEFAAYLLPKYAWIPSLAVMFFARHMIEDVGSAFWVHRIAAAALVTSIYYGKAGRFGEFLERPISLFLGEISYSFYLYAVFVMQIIDGPFKAWPWAVSHPLEVGLPLSVVVVLLTIPIAMASYRWVEKPSIWMGNKVATFWMAPWLRMSKVAPAE
ncbi:acyltransferase [Mesorhizobium sp. CA13]|uniref:acyltransferase family protein n=1 Tax=Mesorhizobium sp. CA13 TaxID=2876643 RepID=UPI001CCD2E89|nr:acyltransferase [Mesorhizobium sp. CA13]MBZ9852784.1 acyltransferase [Mesorhizobium sp. CA13]